MSGKSPQDWDPQRYLLYNRGARATGAFRPRAALEYYRQHGGPYTFADNSALRNKGHVLTLLGYSAVSASGQRHTNWFPWNRFLDVFETLGYQCEWTEISELHRANEKRIFITWNEPTALQLYRSGQVRDGDIVLQKLTSLGQGMESVSWTADPVAWGGEWEWPIYRTVEFLADIGCQIYAFGCKTDHASFPEKHRIVERLGNRIFWIPWGGTPFDWDGVLGAAPKLDDLTRDAVFVGSKWGSVGRGNLDAWERYVVPLEQSDQISFEKFGGIGDKMLSDEDMVALLATARICPIVHAPSWQAERGVQDRFYTVFLTGRFGICDNLGAVDMFGSEIAPICTEDPEEYYKRTLNFCRDIPAQEYYIKFIQDQIKVDYNFYVTWLNILCALPES